MAYLRMVTGGIGGWFQVVAIDPEKKAPIDTRTFRDPEFARRFIERHNGKRNLYYCANPLRSKLTKKAAEADIAAVAYFYADLDCKTHGAGQALRREIAVLRSKVEACRPRPSVIVHTGNGIQALWRLEEPVSVEAGRKAINKLLQHKLGGDHVSNFDRLLRLPGTVNIPDEGKRAKGRVRTLSKVLWPNAKA